MRYSDRIRKFIGSIGVRGGGAEYIQNYLSSIQAKYKYLIFLYISIWETSAGLSISLYVSCVTLSLRERYYSRLKC